MATKPVSTIYDGPIIKFSPFCKLYSRKTE